MVLEVTSVGSLLHVYGVTSGGVSVRAEVSNFWPFLYCLPTVTCADGSRRPVRQADLPVLRRMLEQELQSSRAAKTLAKNAPPPASTAAAASAASSSSTPKKAAATGTKRATASPAASSFFGGGASKGSKSKPVEVDDDDDDDAAGGGDGGEDDDFIEEDAEEEESGGGGGAGSGGVRSCVVAIKLVQKRSLMYYRGNELSTFVQIWLSSPTLLTPAHQILSKRMPSQSAASVGLAASAAAAAAAAAADGEHVKVCDACTLEQGAERKTCAACDTALPAPVKRAAVASAVAAAAAPASSSSAAVGSGSVGGGDGDAAVSFSASGELFGTNIEHYLRFMVESEIVGGGWATLRAGRYDLVPAAHRRTRCAVELRVKWSAPGEEVPAADQAIHGAGSAASSAAAAEDVSTAALAPLRILSFDVQVCSSGGATPRPDRDPITGIANEAVWYPSQSGSGAQPVKVLFLLRASVGPAVPAALAGSGLPSCTIVWCDSEAELLLRWRDFFLRIDPDIVTGYDVAERDVPFLLARAAIYERAAGDVTAGAAAAKAAGAALSPPPPSKRTKRASPASSSSVAASAAAAASPLLAAGACTAASAADFSDWACLGRDGRSRSTLHSIQTYTAGWVKSKKRMTATSNQASAYLRMDGRLFFDVQRIVQTTHSLRTYSLQECAHEFLGRPEEYLDETALQRLLERTRDHVPAADLPAAAAAAAALGAGARTGAGTGAPSLPLARQSSAAFRLALDQSARPAAAASSSSSSAAVAAAASAPGKKLTAKDRKRRREIEYDNDASGAAAAAAAATPSAGGPATPAPTVAPSQFNSPLSCFSRFASYASRQAELPLLLLSSLMVVVQSVEMARTTGTNIRDIWTRGQMIRTWSLLLRHCAASPERFIVPSQRDNSQAQTMTSGPWIFDCTAEGLGTTGLHSDPVATLDFASLYPSIMIAHNLCYSTILVREDEGKIVPDDDTILTPIYRRFVAAHVRRGVVPQILEALLAARKAVKAQIKAVQLTDPFLAGVLNERQKALKISANATYGFTGSSASRLMLVELAEATINYGSKLLQQSAVWVAERFGKGTPTDTGSGTDTGSAAATGSVAGGGRGCRVIYGDTDSLMILMPGRTVSEAMALARAISASITASLPAPMQFAYEKIYCPFLLQQNKKYAGVMYGDSADPARAVLDVKGMESVRRDIIPLVRRLMETVLRELLVDRDLGGAVATTKRCIGALLADRFTLHDLLITKALWRGTDAAAYGAKLAHIELAEKLRRRYPGREIALGQRVSYVLTQGEKGVKQWQQSEEPGYVDEKSLPLDLELYVANFLQKPLVRLFALPGLLGSADKATKTLFSGEHMRAVKRGAPSAEKGLGAFFKREAGARCAHCKRPITGAGAGAGAGVGASPSKASASVAASPFAAAAAATKKGFARVGAKPAAAAAAASSSTGKAAAPSSSSSAAAASSAPPRISHGLCADCERNMSQVVSVRVAEYANREAKMATLAMQWCVQPLAPSTPRAPATADACAASTAGHAAPMQSVRLLCECPNDSNRVTAHLLCCSCACWLCGSCVSHRCQSGGGSMLREIMCVNEDCAIYWDRKKTWRGVQESHKLLMQLEW